MFLGFFPLTCFPPIRSLGGNNRIKAEGLARCHVNLWPSIRSMGRFYRGMDNDSLLGPCGTWRGGRGEYLAHKYHRLFSILASLGLIKSLSFYFYFVTL